MENYRHPVQVKNEFFSATGVQIREKDAQKYQKRSIYTLSQIGIFQTTAH